MRNIRTHTFSIGATAAQEKYQNTYVPGASVKSSIGTTRLQCDTDNLAYTLSAIAGLEMAENQCGWAQNYIAKHNRKIQQNAAV